VKQSPVTYFLDKVYNGNSLWNTTTLGNEKGRERVYDTIFRLPWRCELLIDVGCFVCFYSFLSLLTVVPTRVVMTSWKLLKTRKFKRPSPIELSDFGCFIIVACGITVLQQIDISLIYHIIRGQATIKLYLIDYVKVLTGMCCKCYFIQQKDLQDVPLKRKHTLSVYLCEVAIDVIKHSFIAKFNNITPIAYSEFLEALCKQVSVDI
ncbi:protein pollen defective in guidance 1-like, partial [Trifolium pratense]